MRAGGGARLARGFARLAAQLAGCFDDVIQPPHVCLGEQATVGIQRELASEFDSTVSDERAGVTALAQPERLELKQYHIGEAIVDLEKVHVVRRYTRHRERSRCSRVQADLERVAAIGDVVGWIGVAFARAQDIDPEEQKALASLDQETMIGLGVHPFLPFMARMWLDRQREQK